MLHLLCSLLFSVTIASADINLLSSDQNWLPSIDSGTATMEVFKTPEAPLAVKITTDAGDESYPKLKLLWDKPQNWANYNRLSGKVRVTCNKPDIKNREMAFCFYDEKFLRMDLPDHPMTQQVKSEYPQVGQWIEFSQWLLDIKRINIVMFDIYMHERTAEPGVEYTFEFAELRLEGSDDGVPFDTMFFAKDKNQAAITTPVGAFNTPDNTTLTVYRDGRVSLRPDGTLPQTARTGIGSGLMVRDATTKAAPKLVGGVFTRRTDENGQPVIRQKSRLRNFGLQVEAEYKLVNGVVEVSGTVLDLRGEDRAITVYFAVPVEGDSWTWWDGVATANEAKKGEGEANYFEGGLQYGLNGMHSYYPLGAISNTSRNEGLTLSISMREPQVHRIGFSPDAERFYIANDFGLIPGTNVYGRNMSSATFRFQLSGHNPELGFRDAVAQYYTRDANLQPEAQCFTERFDRKKHAGWLVWGHVNDTPGAIEGGLRLHWGPGGNDAIKFDNANEVTTLQYIEAEYFQETMGDYTEMPTATQGLDRLKKLDAGDEVEMAAYEKLGYAASYLPGAWIHQHGLRAQIAAAARATVRSAYYDVEGLPFAMPGKLPWMTESQLGIIFPLNLDPDIPEGKGSFALDKYIETGLQDALDNGCQYDGIALDSLGGYGQHLRANYRREHFQYVNSPLTFSAREKAPVQPAWYGTVEWLNELSGRLHPRGLVLMANCAWGFTPAWLTFAAPYLDIFGAEATSFGDSYFARFIAKNRNVTDLPYSPQPDDNVAWHALLGIFAGHGNKTDVLAKYFPTMQLLEQAGWEPITGALVEPGNLKIERFGSTGTKYLVVSNYMNSETEAKITLTEPLLAKTPNKNCVNLLSAVSLLQLNENNEFTISLGAGSTVVLEVK